MPQDFKESPAWKLSYDFVKDIYSVSQSFPKEERYAFTSQIRRASMSIPLNLAEGHGRRPGKDFLSFVYNALGSAKEVECCLMLARDFKYITQFQFAELNEKLDHIGRTLTLLRKSTESDISNKENNK